MAYRRPAFVAHPSSSNIEFDTPSSTYPPPPPTSPKLRPRAYSCYSSSPATDDEKQSSFTAFQYRSSSFLESLDLSGSMFSLRKYILGKLQEAEDDVKLLRAYVEESESEDGSDEASGDEGDNEEEDGEGEVITVRENTLRRRRRKPPTMEPQTSKAEISALEQFIATATNFLSAIRDELPSLPLSPVSTPSATSLVQFQLSPDAREALDRFLDDHPLPSFPDIRERLGESRRNASESATALLNRLSLELNGLQDILTEMSRRVPDSQSLTSYFPSLPSLPPLPTPPPIPPLSSVREYFANESEKLNQAVRSYAPSKASISANLRTLRAETSETFHHSIAVLREEATEFTSLLSSHSAAALDEAAKIYHSAVENGRLRLLHYHELPYEWRNNEHVLSGYRFIRIESWGVLLRSAFEFHNETVNIQSHFLGFVALLYVAFFLLPSSPHALPDASWADTAVAVLFLVAAMKCLLCSSIWHLMSGCATLHIHNAFACVDYAAISGLIAGSVMGAEYYGFYCRPDLATVYMTFSGVLGIAGMILPWQAWFNERKHKMSRIAFFLGLALSATMPMTHMCAKYGVSKTGAFLAPALPSLIAYLVGLFFYAKQFPECYDPGRWDNILASHQLWHIAILLAIYAHWRAMAVWVVMAKDHLSCAVP